MDFIDSNNANNFVLNYDSVSSRIPLEQPTMILVKNYLGKTIREKVTYELNPKAIEFLNENTYIQILADQTSYIIGFEIDAANLEDELFIKSKTFNEEESLFLWLTNSENESLKKATISVGALNEVLIRNVGQGNWNEIYTNQKLELIFDIGTHYPASRSSINNLVKSRIAIINSDQPSLIISHWDVDHYHCLFGLNSADIAAFKIIIFRTEPPTLTARKAHQNLVLNNKNCYPVKPEPKAPKGSKPKDDLMLINKSNNLLLFNSR